MLLIKRKKEGKMESHHEHSLLRLMNNEKEIRGQLTKDRHRFTDFQGGKTGQSFVFDTNVGQNSTSMLQKKCKQTFFLYASHDPNQC